MSKPPYENAYQMARDFEDDFDRWPLPICFDPGEEQRELYRRTLMIERICERWWDIYVAQKHQKA